LGYSLVPIIPIIDNRTILHHCFLMVLRKRTMTMIPIDIFHVTSQRPLFGEPGRRRKPLCLWKVLPLIANATDGRFQGSLTQSVSRGASSRSANSDYCIPERNGQFIGYVLGVGGCWSLAVETPAVSVQEYICDQRKYPKQRQKNVK